MTETEQEAAREFERQHIVANDLLRLAQQEPHEGVARVMRRMAAGHKAAATKIARRFGWM